MLSSSFTDSAHTVVEMSRRLWQTLSRTVSARTCINFSDAGGSLGLLRCIRHCHQVKHLNAVAGDLVAHQALDRAWHLHLGGDRKRKQLAARLVDWQVWYEAMAQLKD